MKYIESIFKDNTCNECHSNNDVKAIRIGLMGVERDIFLCKECRVKLGKLLTE